MLRAQHALRAIGDASMKYMMTYDMMESARNTQQWLGATARAMASYPAMSWGANPAMDWLHAWGEVTERTFSRMVMKPDWNLPPVPGEKGRDYPVVVETVVSRPFGDLIHFTMPGRKPSKRRVLLVAPMSGHYATLLRKTVISLLPDADVYITDWHNARDIPVSAGKFDIEDYTLYLMDFMRELGSDLHVIAVCQPVPLTLAATADLAEQDPAAQPKSLTLIGGPVDPEANHTDVTDFGRSVTMGQLEETMIQRVGFKYAGVGRMVYPGLLQLASFISMNGESHANSFRDEIIRVATTDYVVASSATDKIFSAPACNRIVAVVAEDQVVARSAVDDVAFIAGIAVDGIAEVVDCARSSKGHFDLVHAVFADIDVNAFVVVGTYVNLTDKIAILVKQSDPRTFFHVQKRKAIHPGR